MTYKGRVAEIIFSNEENGYTVLNFETDGDFFTAVGIFPFVNEGDYLVVTGEFKKNNRFGEQFVVTEVEISVPDDLEGIYHYLSSGLFRGVGKKIARQIVDYFGMRTIDILDNSPELLQKVPGIGRAKLADIIESYRSTKEMKDTLFFLQKLGLSVGMSLKIYKQFGDTTISAVSNNPYSLIEMIDGVGFLTADKIGEKLGIDKDSEFRIKAGIVHVLNEVAGRGGHTCLPRENLLEEVSKLLGLDREMVDGTLNIMYSVKSETVEGVELIATDINYRSESAIATKLILLKKCADKWLFSPEKELARYETSSSITLHEKQRDAILSAFYNGVTVITGGPGTGKTTIIKAITSIATEKGKNVILCAPTGRASKRMTEMTGMESKTIHRLLGVESQGRMKFEKDENNPLTADIIIVDEISMADIYIFHALLKAIPRGARLVLVGDKDQLPSVSCGNILSDVIGSGQIDVVFLTEVYRQSLDSYIITNAHRINRGEMPLPDNRHDFFVNNKNDVMDILNTVIGMLKTRIPKFANVTPNDIQVLAPIKKGIVGVENLNEVIQRELNPDGMGYTHGKTVFREGDKVMQTTNNYCLEWRKTDGEIGSGVFNGDIGIVARARKDGVDVIFDDGKLVSYDGSDLDELTLAYCVSVHKSQGSEFPVVILVLSGANYLIMTRNLLYTAVTRAKRMVVIVGEEACIKKMVANNYTAKRYSLLRHFLVKNVSRVEMLWG